MEMRIASVVRRRLLRPWVHFVGKLRVAAKRPSRESQLSRTRRQAYAAVGAKHSQQSSYLMSEAEPARSRGLLQY